MLAFPKNKGLRLDYIFATAPLAVRYTSAEIDRQERKGEKPSDRARSPLPWAKAFPRKVVYIG